nr:MAG TPA: DASH complex subunit Dad3 [Caudoviricetes sp.]
MIGVTALICTVFKTTVYKNSVRREPGRDQGVKVPDH